MTDTTHNRKVVEPDAPPIKILLKWLSVPFVIFIASLILLNVVFQRTTRDEIYNKELSLTNPALLELRAKDKARLTEYDVVDQEMGLFQIPIEKAMNELANKPNLILPITNP
ncbi:MAG TPA: hypothetical protein VJL87_02615 [Bdellovibrionota bacterium]|nr:hypothetical protein [Bdellovibrionota bacterium]